MERNTKVSCLALVVLTLSATNFAAAQDQRARDIFSFCVNAGAATREEQKATVLVSGAMRREMSAGELMREAWIANQASKAHSGEMHNKLRNRAI